jgi:hypothetical protein
LSGVRSKLQQLEKTKLNALLESNSCLPILAISAKLVIGFQVWPVIVCGKEDSTQKKKAQFLCSRPQAEEFTRQS